MNLRTQTQKHYNLNPSVCSTTDRATLVSFVICLFFAEDSKVFINIKSSTISAHTGVTWGELSFDSVARKARFLP